jgi:hypothetical protein
MPLYDSYKISNHDLIAWAIYTALQEGGETLTSHEHEALVNMQEYFQKASETNRGVKVTKARVRLL